MPKTATKPKDKTKGKSRFNDLREDLDIKDKAAKNTTTALPSVLGLSKKCVRQLWDYRLLFIGVLLIYGILNFAITQGYSAGTSVASLNSQLNGQYKGNPIANSLAIYTLMFSPSNNASSSSGASGVSFGLIMLIIASLAVIWVVRNISNKVKVRIRDAYYKGMYPLVPFVIILSLIALELLPLVIGGSIYAAVTNGHIANTAIEQLAFGLIAFILGSLTMYLLSSTAFALYMVTLPDMTPVRALKASLKLVRKRRFPIILRLLYLPLILLVVSGVVMLPVIIFIPSIAPWVFMVLALVLLALFHLYMYNFYRELL